VVDWTPAELLVSVPIPEDIIDRTEIDWLDQVMLESRGPRSLPIRFLAISSKRDQSRAVQTWYLTETGGEVVAIHNR
jgi:hypothetical protein